MAEFDFPKLSYSVVSQLPYTETDDWVVATSDMDCGKSYTRTISPGLGRRFIINADLIQRDEVETLQRFFDFMRGRLGEFNYTDDQGLKWTRVRFDQDALDVRYVAPNHYSTEIRLLAERNPS